MTKIEEKNKKTKFSKNLEDLPKNVQESVNYNTEAHEGIKAYYAQMRATLSQQVQVLSRRLEAVETPKQAGKLMVLVIFASFFCSCKAIEKAHEMDYSYAYRQLPSEAEALKADRIWEKSKAPTLLGRKREKGEKEQ